MPSSKNYVRNYKQEAATESPARKRARAARNQARAQLMKEGKLHKGDGKEANHVKPLSKGGSNSRSNITVVKASKNHSYARTSSGAMKAKLSNPSSKRNR